MANLTFNISLGRVNEKIADANTNVGLLLLKAAEADATLRTRATVAAILAEAGNTECDFTNYARKTGLTGSVTVDNVNHRGDSDLPDQTFTSAGGALNNDIVKAIVFYEDSASDAGRVPLTMQDFVLTTDGTDLIVQINVFYRAQG